jgi:hypothetical protein
MEDKVMLLEQLKLANECIDRTNKELELAKSCIKSYNEITSLEHSYLDKIPYIQADLSVASVNITDRQYNFIKKVMNGDKE